MKPEDRRRFGAVAALAAGVFMLLALIPGIPTGPLGSGLGSLCWRGLGAGAVGLPLLGLGLGLTGFDRIPRLDMKRSAILVVGLAILVPFTIGVLVDISAGAFDPPTPEWGWPARLTGIVPGFLSRSAIEIMGQTGGLILGFVALTGLTLATIAWHPLARFEKKALPEDSAAGRLDLSASRRQDVPDADEEDEDDAPAPVAQRARRTAETTRRPAAEPPRRPAAETSGAAELLPPLDLLNPAPPQDVEADTAQLDRLGQRLLETLQTFKVDGSIAGRTSGPVVTQFEIVPAPGVKAGRIMALADDLAITMRAMSIRVAPIPGRGAVGVEVPNPVARMVTLRELLESPEWDRSRSRAVMPIALGRDLEGKPVVTDLAKMPHLLIAGATGSGKSVAINTIVTGLVYRYPPSDLRFLMIDPKMVELSMYNALPHKRHSVVTGNHDAARVLKWAVYEMNRRYELLHANGARNLGDFNRKVDDGKPLRHPARPQPTLAGISAEAEPGAPEPPQPQVYQEGRLPHLVIVVDELADLMMTVQGEVETPLALLAQKARAIGIHLILATQRPSVNVITGLIKANLPSRISFRVSSKIDSRTILDGSGAEQLLGKGDMLFLPPASSRHLRLHGPYISEQESARLASFLRKQGRPTFDDSITADDKKGGPDDLEYEKDELYDEAARIVVQSGQVSISYLQRKMRIGFSRAARLVDMMEAEGLVSSGAGGKPREVLVEAMPGGDDGEE